MAASRRDRAHTRRTVPDVIPNLLGLLRQYRDRYHELALLVSPMSQAEFEELVRSIARVGLLNTIKMLNGKVIDGVHRDLACIVLGIPPRTEELAAGTDPLTYVMAQGFTHRDPTPAQRAAMAVALVPQVRVNPRAFATDNSSGGRHAREAVTIAARFVGAGINAVQQLVRVQGQAPEVLEEVRLGRVRGIRGALRRAGLREAPSEEERDYALAVSVVERVLRATPSARRFMIFSLVNRLANDAPEDFNILLAEASEVARCGEARTEH